MAVFYRSVLSQTVLLNQTVGGTLRYQTHLILNHYEFGAQHGKIFVAAYSLFFMDSFVYQSAIQFLILVVLLVYVHIYARAQMVDPSVTRKMLRTI